MRDYNLKHLIKKAAKVTETMEMVIDVILVNNKEKIMKTGVMNIGKADDRLIYIH